MATKVVASRKRKAPEEDPVVPSDPALAAKRRRTLAHPVVLAETPINFPKVRLVACGSNEMFQLGIPGGESIETPRPCRGLGNVNLLGLVSGGGANAALLSSAEGAKQLWTWGCNDSGALGRVAEDEDAQSIPAPIPELTGKDITHFSAGDSHMAVVTADGKLYTWGSYRDANGVLGFKHDSDKESQLHPELFQHIPAVSQVASGENSTLILTARGDVWIWGDHKIGRRSTARHARELRKKALEPNQIHLKKYTFDMIAAGGFHYFARSKNDHKLYAWGLNNFGQLGLGLAAADGAETEDEEVLFAPQPVPKPVALPFDAINVKQIAAGQHHSLILAKDGRVFAFGRTNYGQLGLGESVKNDKTRIDVPTPIPTFDELPADNRVVHIASGGHHCIAITAKGDAYAWGFGSTGALCQGQGEDDDCSVPTKIPLNQGMQAAGRIIYGTAGGQHTILVLPRPPEDAAAPQTTQKS